MRVVLSSVKCNWCETAYEFDEDDEDQRDINSVLAHAGWFYVEHGDKEYDFCSEGCLVAQFS